MKLNKAVLVRLMEEADQEWMRKHHGQYLYREHLEFVADHIITHAPRTGKPRPKLSEGRDDSFSRKARQGKFAEPPTP